MPEDEGRIAHGSSIMKFKEFTYELAIEPCPCLRCMSWVSFMRSVTEQPTSTGGYQDQLDVVFSPCGITASITLSKTGDFIDFYSNCVQRRVPLCQEGLILLRESV